MKFEKKDLVQVENLVRCLKKGRFDLDAMEAVAFADVVRWVGNLHTAVKAEAEAPPVTMQAQAVPPMSAPVKKKKAK